MTSRIPDWAVRHLPFLLWLPSYRMSFLKADSVAAITGATLVLPQGIAFAAIAGLPPEYGFYTAIIPPIIAALFGSSWHLVSGPTTAISALVFGALSGSLTPGSAEFIQAAITLTLLVGLFQLAFGLARLGALVDFVSHSVMTGFTAGAAILIGLSQIRHVLGIDLPRPEHFVEFVVGLAQNIGGANLYSVIIATVSLALAVGIRIVWPKAPNYLLALAGASLLSMAIGALGKGVQAVGSIPSVVPTFGMPQVSFEAFSDLAPSALAIAIVGLLEAVTIARSITIRSNQALDANREFVGQGLSNTVGSFFHCYASSGSFTRSGVNYEAGAKTPMAAILAALFLFLILLFVAPWFAYVPIPAMAGVIMLVAWKLIDFRAIRHIFSTSRSEAVIATATFCATLFINLEFAIYVGVFLSLLIFLNKTARPFIGIGAPDPSTPNGTVKNAALNNLAECPQLIICRIDGVFYFGSVEFVRRWFRRMEIERADQKHMLFIVIGVGDIDMSAAEVMIEEAARRKARGGSFHVQTKTPSTIKHLVEFHVDEALSTAHIHEDKGEAISEIFPMLDPSVCATCSRRIFKECAGMPAPLEEPKPDTGSRGLIR